MLASATPLYSSRLLPPARRRPPGRHMNPSTAQRFFASLNPHALSCTYCNACEARDRLELRVVARIGMSLWNQILWGNDYGSGSSSTRLRPF